LEIDDASINNTEYGVSLEGGSNTENVTNSEITNAGTAGLYIKAQGAERFVHFNTFSSNELAIDVEDMDGDAVYLTFNDIVDNTNGLDVASQSADEINATYSWWDNWDYSRIVGPYTLQNAGSQLPIPRRVYPYTRLHTGGQP
jgi:hypothetical protein